MDDAFDVRDFRRVLGSFMTGVTIVTTRDAAGRAHGLTVNSFSSVSLDPPLVLWSQSITAPSYPIFSRVDRFAVNILAEDQRHIADRFSRPAADKFEGIATHDGLDSVPLIDGCAAYLECVTVAKYPGGDHTIFVGRVERIARFARPPLIFGGGRYLRVSPWEPDSSMPDAMRHTRNTCNDARGSQ